MQRNFSKPSSDGYCRCPYPDFVSGYCVNRLCQKDFEYNRYCEAFSHAMPSSKLAIGNHAYAAFGAVGRNANERSVLPERKNASPMLSTSAKRCKTYGEFDRKYPKYQQAPIKEPESNASMAGAFIGTVSEKAVPLDVIGMILQKRRPMEDLNIRGEIRTILREKGGKPAGMEEPDPSKKKDISWSVESHRDRIVKGSMHNIIVHSSRQPAANHHRPAPYPNLLNINAYLVANHKSIKDYVEKVLREEIDTYFNERMKEEWERENARWE